MKVHLVAGGAVAGLAAIAGALAMASAAQAATPGDDISGTWTLRGYKSSSLPAETRIPQTLEGTAPPLQAWAKVVYDQRIADSDRGSPYAPTSASCLPLGMPLMMMAANMPIKVIVSPGQVSLLFEEQHTFRAISLDRKTHPNPDDLDPGFFGDSIGHWEGSTLVVDTVGLNDRTTLDLTGLPHSEALHVIEHIRRVDAHTLEDLITIDDPKTFTRPWTTRKLYDAFDGQMLEYVCDNNRNRPDANNHATYQRPAQ